MIDKYLYLNDIPTKGLFTLIHTLEGEIDALDCKIATGGMAMFYNYALELWVKLTDVGELINPIYIVKVE